MNVYQRRNNFGMKRIYPHSYQSQEEDQERTNDLDLDLALAKEKLRQEILLEIRERATKEQEGMMLWREHEEETSDGLDRVDSPTLQVPYVNVVRKKEQNTKVVKDEKRDQFDVDIDPAVKNFHGVDHAATPNARTYKDLSLKHGGNRFVFFCVVVVLLYLGLGVLLGVYLEGWNVVDSLYFSIVTLTTVGYGIPAPSTQAGRLACTFYVIIGIGMIAAAFGIVGEYIMDKLDGEDEPDAVVEHAGFWTPNKKKIMFSIVSIVIVIGVGILFFVYSEGFSFVDAFYLSVITLTTVGYGDISPQSERARIFSILWIAIGTLVVARGLGTFIDTYLDEKQKQMRKKILVKQLDMDDLFRADDDDSGTVTQAEFIIFKIEQMGLVSASDLHAIADQFKVLDKDGSGFLTKDEARGAKINTNEDDSKRNRRQSFPFLSFQ